MNKHGLCKFCGKEKAFIAAHIIPLSLYPKNPNGDRHLKILSIDGKRHTSDLRNGYFDSEMVCRDCEDLFDPYDAYAVRFFRLLKSLPILVTKDGLKYREVSNYDRKRLKLFYLSLLWRAHTTTLYAFNKVDLGPYANIVKNLIKRDDPGSDELFNVAIFTLEPHEKPELDISGFSTTPVPRRLDGKRYFEFVIFGFVAFIHVGNQPAHSAFRAAGISSNRNLLVQERNNNNSPFLGYLEQCILNMDKSKQRRKC